MITRTAGAKLLDFGLAKATAPQPAISPDEPTVAHADRASEPLTERGTVLGTFQYMSPEQLEGRDADARTDIFAFGAMLYEMLTGRKAFDGKSRATVLAAILATEPRPVRDLQPLVPPQLERTIRLCLEKDPDERWQTAHDLKLELQGISLGETIAVATRSRPAMAGWIAAGAILIAAAAGYAFHTRSHGPAASLHLSIPPPADHRYNSVDGPAVISPDGSRIVVRFQGDGTTQPLLWVRRLDGNQFQRVEGTNGAIDQFRSPSGSEIAFFSMSKLRIAPVSGGASRTVATVGDPRGGTWSRNGTILVAATPSGPIMRVGDGGKLVPVTRLDPARKETGHWRPQFLPDGERFLFLAHSADREMTGVYMGKLGSSEVKRILDVRSTTIYAEPGVLLHELEGVLYGQSVDPDTLDRIGTPFVVARSIDFDNQYAAPAYHYSAGILVYHAAQDTPTSELVRFDRSGRQLGIIPGEGVNLDLSRDGSRLAMSVFDRTVRGMDVWLVDLARGARSRITFGEDPDIGPVWSPDGKLIAYATQSGGKVLLRIRNASGAGEERTIRTLNYSGEVVDWTLDGRYLIIEDYQPSQRTNLVATPLNGGPDITIAATQFNEDSGRISPDGKWIAFGSDDSGRPEVYVQPFPPDGRRWQVSTEGGVAPRWRRDGKELFFTSLANDLHAMKFDASLDPPITVSEKLGPIGTTDYVVKPDGNEFIASRGGDAAGAPLEVLLNWRPPVADTD